MVAVIASMVDPPVAAARTTLGDYRPAAEICRAHGWVAGTLLGGDEGDGQTIIEIRYVGETMMVAKQISHNGDPRRCSDEHSWCLAFRDWREVAA